MNDKTENPIVPSKASSVIYFSFLVLTSSAIMWVFICIAIKLKSVPQKQLPNSLLYSLTFVFYPMFVHHIAGKCLKTIPLGKYTYQIGIIMIIVLFLFWAIFVGMLEFTFIPGILFK
ncbi:MAG: hypothetical protein K0S75_2760 [Clostridia bacterium]|jgi:hypothetical protein|nr:hypothetical protein [Clostridia bacterium]